MKSAARPSTRSRSKKKAAPSPSISPAESSTTPAAATLEPADTDPLVAEPAGHEPRPIGEIEGVLSLVLGVLFIISALFPRSIKQLLLLGLGGGLVYRGMTGHSDLSRKLGIDD